MSFQSYRPGPPLTPFVDAIWSMSNGGVPSSRQRICPTGAMELVIHLSRRDLSFFEGGVQHQIRVPILAGAYSKSFSIDPAEFTSVLAVRFRPGCAGMFFPIPAHELHNTDIPLADAWPEEAKRLLDQLLAARSASARLRTLERYLTSKLPGVRKPPPPAVEYAVREFQSPQSLRTIADVRSDLGLSHTRFIQIFREHVGLTPKLFCRVQRFRRALDGIEKGMPVRWADLAADCGYFDQAHLIHDFRAFAGVTPQSYLAS